MKILITGSSGFIGRNLTELLPTLNENYEILNPSSSELNLLDYDAVKNYFEVNDIEAIIHCATWDASRISTKDQNLVLKNNLKMFFNIVFACHKDLKIITLGSGAEYGRYSGLHLVNENRFGQIIPDEDYGFSKFIISAYSELTKNIYVLRLFGVFGKYEKWQIRFISNACCRAMFDLPIIIKQNVFFDYLYVNDLVKIIDWFLKNKPKYRCYNVCTSNPIDLLSIAKIVKKVSGKNHLPIKILKDGLQPEYTGDNSRLVSEIKDIKFTDIESAIAELYKYYLTTKDTINKKELEEII